MVKIQQSRQTYRRWCAFGLGADDTYCALYAGAGVAGALELKDKLYGGKWDWVDFGCTMAGVVVGRLIRVTLTGK